MSEVVYDDVLHILTKFSLNILTILIDQVVFIFSIATMRHFAVWECIQGYIGPIKKTCDTHSVTKFCGGCLPL